MREVRLIAESQLVCDPRYGDLPVTESAGRPLHTEPAQVFAGRATHVTLEDAAEVDGMHACRSRELAYAGDGERGIVQLLHGSDDPSRSAQ
jgi:hypothetical protein